MASIFVSIASYRDPELAHTIDQLLRHTSTENSLRIRILSQCHADERIGFPAASQDGRIRIEQRFVDPERSRGACWARAEIQRDYAGEDYYLQLDSHMQFVDGWDRLLLEDHAAAEQHGGPAVITAYLPVYRFENGTRVVDRPVPTHFKVRLTEWAPWLPTAVAMAGYPHARPCKAHFFSGHFAFARASFIEDVPYDPEIFFMGEEISMAVRAYCAGYALYTPTRYIGAHLYARVAREGEARPLFWDEAEDARRKLNVRQREQASRIKVAAICRGEWPGLYGVRSMRRYREFRDALQQRFGIDLAQVVPPGLESQAFEPPPVLQGS